MVRLENWSVTYHPQDSWRAPECRTMHLCGEVFGHPNYPEGHKITTSNVKAVNGRQITCASRVYVLGQPAAEYVQWCKDKKVHVPTDECPIKG